VGAYASFLTPRQREALAEIDARPAQYMPRRRITAAGVALMAHQVLDDLDQRERAAREARDRAEAEARELRERQRRHPLYHTHHRDQLLKTWKEHGEPAIPPRALDSFTPWIMQHANALEDDVRQYAKILEKSQNQTIIDRLGKYADRFYRDKNPAELTQRNIRRALRSAFRQFNEQAAHVLKIVGKKGQKYISNDNKSNRRHQLKQQQRWIEASSVEGPHLPKPISLSACIRTVEARAAELYALSKGLETYMATQGKVALFVTLTSPAHFHPNPTYGQNSWDGSSVTDSHQWFTQQWSRFRTDLKNKRIRINGMRVTEPHQDGAEHWHVLIYASNNEMDDIKSAISKRFGHSKNSAVFEEGFISDPEHGKASAASYMQKYLLKALTLTGQPNGTNGTEGTDGLGMGTPANDTKQPAEHGTAGAEAADAWRATWNIRGFQFFGLLYGKQTLWRELRRLDHQPDDPTARRLWRAARGTRAHLFIAALDTDRPEVAAIRELHGVWSDPDPATGETQLMGYKAGRILGIEVNGCRYLTRPATACRITTDYSGMRDPCDQGYTVIHSCPSGEKGFPDFDHPPPNRPPRSAAA